MAGSFVEGHDVGGDVEGTFRFATSHWAMTFVTLLMLSVESLNPVQILCFVSQGFICERFVAIVSSLGLVVLVVNQADRLVYESIKLFFRANLHNVFFKSVDVIGVENLPVDGPLILTGNHNNQFVDAALMATSCPRQISFMIAEKSYHRPGIGHIAKAVRSIPVGRPQDVAVAGKGTLLMDGSVTVRGQGTQFTTQIITGATILLKGQEAALKINKVISDSELELAAPAPIKDASKGIEYKVLPKIDQAQMYNSVFGCLKEGRCFGIFPEGGSHDRTDLLPLKAGVAIIALDAYKKHNVNVPIIPVGLNYFRGHRFRGRVVIEFGTPIWIDEQLHALHDTDKRGATEKLLEQITEGMRSVIVPTPDYRQLQMIYCARRLYVSEGLKLTSKETLDLDRRFARGLQLFDKKEAESSGCESPTAQAASSGSPKMKPESSASLSIEMHNIFEDLRGQVIDYMQTLKRLGLRDHQVRQIRWWGVADFIGRAYYLACMLGLGALPNLLFNFPVSFIVQRWATMEQAKALKGSTVKLAARDVIMSYQIIFVFAVVPVLYCVYVTLLIIFSGWSWRAISLAALSSPILSYCGIKASEQGVRAYMDLVPLLVRLQPGPRREQNALTDRRADLAKKIRKAVAKFRAEVGEF